MTEIHNVTGDVQAFTSNVFLVDGDRTVLVDAGANFDVVSALEADYGVDESTLDAVVVTHTHYDHVENVPAVREAFDVESWGFDTGHEAVDNELPDEATLRLGDEAYVAIHTPGHKNDHLCLYSAEAGVLFAGDLVFANGNFGRTDLEEGDRDRLVESIDRLRARVSEDLAAMHTGHGPSVYDDAYEDIAFAGRAARMH